MSDPSLRSIAHGLVGSAESVLLVGLKLPLRAHWRELGSVSAASELHATFEGIVFQPRSLHSRDLLVLKSKLSPGGKLLIYVESRRGPVALLRSLLERSKPESPALHQVCEQLLGTGFLEPTVYGIGKRAFVVSAQKPKRMTELDAFFEQPHH
jgi:hypothetical protein